MFRLTLVSGHDANVTLVSMHIRRTDYAHHLSVLFNMTLVEDSYFATAVNHFKKKFSVTGYNNIFKSLFCIYKCSSNSQKTMKTMEPGSGVLVIRWRDDD
jgi:hypothetical protein